MLAQGTLMHLGGAAYPVETLPDWGALEAKLRRWIAAPAAAGASLLALPEYAGMEAALVGLTARGDGERGVSDPDQGGALHPAASLGPELDAAAWYRRAADLAEAYTDLCRTTARDAGIWLLSGSGPVWDDGGGIVNRAWLIAPDGASAPIDKLILTPWERSVPGLRGGQGGPRCFDTELGRIGVLICYDSEFPELAAPLEADVILVPSCTESLAGQTRVRNAVRARALEEQCYVVQAPLVGKVPDCPVIDVNTGRALVAAPPDAPFEQTGLLAQTALGCPGWAMAPYDRRALAQTRQNGQVAPLAHRRAARARALEATTTQLGQVDA